MSFFVRFEFPAVNVFCKQSRNDKRSLSVMMGENSEQRRLLSWEQRWFVSAIRSLIPLGSQVPTEANKCVRDSPREDVAWAQAGQAWMPVLAACLPSDHREVTGPVRAFIFPSVKWGCWSFSPRVAVAGKEALPGKAPGPQQPGELGSRGGACQGRPSAARAPRLCAPCLPFPEGSFVTSA